MLKVCMLPWNPIVPRQDGNFIIVMILYIASIASVHQEGYLIANEFWLLVSGKIKHTILTQLCVSGSAGQYFAIFHWTIYRIVDIFWYQNIVSQYLLSSCMWKTNVMAVYSLDMNTRVILWEQVSDIHC